MEHLIIRILVIVLVVWLVLAVLMPSIPSPRFANRDPLFVVLAIILAIVLLRYLL